MKMNFNYNKKYSFNIIFMCIFIIFSGIWYRYYIRNNYAIISLENINTLNSELKSDYTKNITVEIYGEVNYPGIYRLKTNDKLYDVIYKAGGVSKNIDINDINEIYFNIPLFDGESIFIDNNCDIIISYSDNINENTIIIDDIQTPEDVTLLKGININTATKDVLMLIPYIGDTISDRIIEYREKNNGFKSIDEIKNIKGIGNKVFEDIKKYIILE